jgi:hypothetical protein
MTAHKQVEKRTYTYHTRHVFLHPLQQLQCASSETQCAHNAAGRQAGRQLHTPTGPVGRSHDDDALAPGALHPVPGYTSRQAGRCEKCETGRTRQGGEQRKPLL